MADEQLSQAEIDVLLGRSDAASDGSLPAAQATTLRGVLDAAARRCAVELSSLLRRTVRMRVEQVRTLGGSERLPAAELSAYQARLDVRPSQSVWAVEIRPTILFPLIDCMLGGGHEPAAIAPRPLTEIERRLAARVVRLLAVALEQAWEPGAGITIADCDDDASSIGKPGEPLIQVVFLLELAGAQGTLHLALPRQALESLLEPQSCPADDVATTEIVAVLAESPLADDPAAELAVGDILATEVRASEPITIYQDGQPRFRARLGAQDGHKAIEIVAEPSAPSVEQPEEAPETAGQCE
jgi:flagellar motor switch protein FliM